MVTAERPPKNNFVKNARKVYNPIGFAKGYNFVLWFIFAGTFFGFILARLQYLNIDGVFCNPSGSGNSALPGECFWYLNYNKDRVGITMHLGTILPAGLLAVLQFTPVIRHKAILYHRIAGYVAILLVIISIFGAFIIADTSFGGDMTIRTFVGFLGVISLLGLGMAVYNIKRKQVDQHRAWMLRTWFWMASIITLRILFAIMGAVISMPSYQAGNAFYSNFPCPQLLWTLKAYNQTLASSTIEDQHAFLDAQYPTCIGREEDLLSVAPVRADLNGNGAHNVAAAFRVNFGVAGILALILHAIGVEIYLKLTPRENERLRIASYHKQLEAGLKPAGSAGLVIEKFGDADPWVAPEERAKEYRDDAESPARAPWSGPAPAANATN